MYIAIAGNIGSGKTTLTELLAKYYNAKGYYEEPDNPYIGDFYEDMSRWSFNLQIYFLASRIEQTKSMVKEGLTSKSHIIQDRTIYEDAHIFARNLADMGLMSLRDLKTYMKTFSLFSSFVPRPDLLIYLRASVPKLKEQILHRGRQYESNIDGEYLRLLNRHYAEWIKDYEGELYEIDVDEVDFENDEIAFAKICNHIDNLNSKNGVLKNP
ncbi:MAG: deoxynucleoside kinase [Rikenellaceae bacterium]